MHTQYIPIHTHARTNAHMHTHTRTHRLLLALRELSGGAVLTQLEIGGRKVLVVACALFLVALIPHAGTSVMCDGEALHFAHMLQLFYPAQLRCAHAFVKRFCETVHARSWPARRPENKHTHEQRLYSNDSHVEKTDLYLCKCTKLYLCKGAYIPAVVNHTTTRKHAHLQLHCFRSRENCIYAQMSPTISLQKSPTTPQPINTRRPKHTHANDSRGFAAKTAIFLQKRPTIYLYLCRRVLYLHSRDTRAHDCHLCIAKRAILLQTSPTIYLCRKAPSLRSRDTHAHDSRVFIAKKATILQTSLTIYLRKRAPYCLHSLW